MAMTSTVGCPGTGTSGFLENASSYPGYGFAKIVHFLVVNISLTTVYKYMYENVVNTHTRSEFYTFSYTHF